MKKTTRQVSRIIQATQSICALPAIPSQGWARDVANAISLISPTSVVGVVIATIDAESLTLEPISTGVSCLPPDSAHSTESINQALYLQDKLERINTLGLGIPDQSLTHGLVAPFSLLHPHWTTTPIGRIFASQKLQSPILAVVPINRTHPGLFLIITIALNPNLADQSKSSSHSPPSTELATGILGCLVPLLAQRAETALREVSHPKAWLTDREQEILDQLILGYSVRVIAENLGRSAHTVHDHVKNLHKKLHASSRGELIAKALGSTSPTDPPRQPTLQPIVLLGTSQLSELKPQHRITHT